MNLADISAFFLVTAFGYLLGGVPFGFLIGKAKGVDVRAHGSGNIGATNVARVLGWRWFFVVFILDFLKGFLPVLGGAWLAGDQLAVFLAPVIGDGSTLTADLALAAGIGAMIGHIFPIYLRLRGGKAVATGLGALIGLSPLAGLSCLGVFLLVFLAGRMVSLGSVTAALTLPVALALVSDDATASPDLGRIIVFSALALLVILRHWPNILRIAKGQERRVALCTAQAEQPVKPRDRHEVSASGET